MCGPHFQIVRCGDKGREVGAVMGPRRRKGEGRAHLLAIRAWCKIGNVVKDGTGTGFAATSFADG
jgi:hypothetical protein